MKRPLITLLLLLFSKAGMAQEHGAQWAISSQLSVLDFRNDTLVNYPIDNWMNMFLTTATICDEQGELLYYTNGIFIADKYGMIVENSTGISPCPYTTAWENTGLNIYQAAIFLPCPENNRYYYLFHFSNDTLNNARPGTLYYSLIDRQGNFGFGSVVRKNVVFAKGKFRGGGMTACKHGNGHDWWLIMGESNNNTFDKFLVTSDSVSGPYRQSIGPAYLLPYDLAYSTFSEDGSKYVTGAVNGYITVFDFDRCTGNLNNPLIIFNNVSTDSAMPFSGCSSMAFSPNGRFLYVSANINLNQYDLWASNIQDSMRIYTADSNDHRGVGFLELAPDGRLFASCWNGGSHYFRVIERPDEKGDSCRFIGHGFYSPITQNTSKLPNMPNYRLGVLGGSACDTITSTPKSPKGDLNSPLRIQPNPADKYVYIEMPAQGNYVFELVNQQGQVVERRETRQVDIINTANLPSGTYFLQVSGSIHATQKVVVQH